jgi:hypothetical protein
MVSEVLFSHGNIAILQLYHGEWSVVFTRQSSHTAALSRWKQFTFWWIYNLVRTTRFWNNLLVFFRIFFNWFHACWIMISFMYLVFLQYNRSNFEIVVFYNKTITIIRGQWGCAYVFFNQYQNNWSRSEDTIRLPSKCHFH